MRLKTFHGNTLSDAMRQVREALGGDAIIVSTRDDDSGGIRVTAAIDDPPAQYEPYAKPSDAPIVDNNKGKPTHEIDSLEVITAALRRHNIPSTFSESLTAVVAQRVGNNALENMAAALAVHLRFMPNEKPVLLQSINSQQSTQVIMLVGAYGAGKTLCIAQLATAAKLANTSVAVITADSERAGSTEQLAAFTNLLDINLIEVCDNHALTEAVAMCVQNNGLVLVDTFGSNPFDAAEMEHVHRLIAAVSMGAKAADNHKTVLVLPADANAADAPDIAQAFANIGCDAIIATRMDMTRQMGGLLHAAFVSKLPLIGMSGSAKATVAPRPPDPVCLAKMLLAPVPLSWTASVISGKDGCKNVRAS